MDLQTRKQHLITYLTQIHDEVFFDKLEGFILKSKKEKSDNLKPFTVEEFHKRIEKSELDFKNGNFKSQEELEKLTSKW